MLTDCWEAKLMAAATYISSNSQQESEGVSFQKWPPTLHFVIYRQKPSISLANETFFLRSVKLADKYP